MAKIEGDLSLMPISDLMQWIEMSRKSGTLLIEFNGIAKRFYLQEGKIIYVSSQRKGEMLGEYLLSKKLLDLKQLKESIQKSQVFGIPFTGYLISEGLLTAETLESIIGEIAEIAFRDALKWEEGTFQFKDSLPPSVVNGPVKINTSTVIFQSIRTLYESQEAPAIDKTEFIKKIAQDVSSGKIELPPVPDIIVKLNSALKNDNTTVVDIAKIIMSDQILTSKILKIVNSSYYARYGKITSLQQAIIYMGLKTLISIVTVYTLGATTTHNADKIKTVLKHSLITAFIARHLSPYLSVDPEEAFVCGLLHDIGKTVILEHLHGQQITDELMNDILARFHTNIGFLLAVKWKFSDVVKETIRLHHNPDGSEKFKDILQLVSTANRLANNLNSEAEQLQDCLKDFLNKGLKVEEFQNDLDAFVKEADLFV